MNARARQEYEHRQVLKKSGWELSQTDSIEWNSGSESLSHFLAKSSIGWVLKQQGYRVSSEVSDADGSRELDLVAYGTEDPPVIIEVEKDLVRETILDKAKRYTEAEPFRDMLVADVDTLPDVEPLETWARDQL